MAIDFLLTVFSANADSEAIIWRDNAYTYQWLQERVAHWRAYLAKSSVGSAGTVIALEGDFSPNSVALFLALVEAGFIVVPLTTAAASKRDEFMEVAQVEASISINEADEISVAFGVQSAKHPIYQTLRNRKHAGLVLFSSGSTGRSKAAVHDVVPLLEKFHTPRHKLRTISFLLYDHIGGINTMLYTLSNGGCLVTVEERSPDSILRAVEQYQVELLPTSPTFINLILLSEAHHRYDLSSLKTVSYGTEPMPESTLIRFHQSLPDIRLLQTYGLSELGILRSKSKSSDSLWVKLGGEGFDYRIVDDLLQIKAASAMLGYLNAPSPFTDDGWFITGDRVEVDGEYLRILGRQSELINVGGEKVYPAEVESVLQEMDVIADAVVYGSPNPITGQIVCADVQTVGPADRRDVVRQIKSHCRSRLQSYKVPVKIKLVTTSQHSARFKKSRDAA